MRSVNIFLFIIFLSLSAFAQVPQTLSFQGILRTHAGNVMNNGEYDLTFRLYEQEQGGTALWTETHSESVFGGVLNIVIGSVNPLNLPFDKPYWLGISINGGPELSPRTRLMASAYSMMAKDVEAGAVVKSVNDLKGNVIINAGQNVSIDKSGNTLTISAHSSGSGSGSEGFIAKFGDDNAIGDSKIYQKDGMIGIQSSYNTNKLEAKFQVNKTNYFLGDTVNYLALFQTTLPQIPPNYTQQAFITKNGDGYFRSNLGIGNKTPQSQLDIAASHWDLTNTEGDFRIGNDNYRLKIGVSTGGAGAGDVRIRAQGGSNSLILGSGTKDVLKIKDGAVGIGNYDVNNKLSIKTSTKSAGVKIGASIRNSDFLGYPYGADIGRVQYNGAEISTGYGLYVYGDTHIEGKVTSGDAKVSLPVGYAIVKNGRLESGTSNIIKVEGVFDKPGKYIITFDGLTYNDDYITTVTILEGAKMCSAYGYGGKLYIETYNYLGALESSNFQFVTYCTK